jgi:hypothetical protein
VALNARARLALVCVLGLLSSCTKGPLDAIDLDPSSLSSGLMAHYTFDEGAGTAVIDHSGNKRDGVLSGGQWLGDGVFAGALQLSNAADDHADVNPFPDAPESFTVSAWARTSAPSADEEDALLSAENVFEGGWELHLRRHVAGLGVHVGYWDTVAMAYTYWECDCLTYDRWTHLAFVRDAATASLTVYADAVALGSVPAPTPIAPGEPQLHIGHWQGDGRYLEGDVDDVAIYGRALTADEIRELNGAPAPVQP